MRAENLEFREAIRRMAQQVGLPLPDRRSSGEVSLAHRINEVACAFFQRALASTQGTEPRAYLENRGLDRPTIETFQLGLAPADGDSLRRHLLGEGFEPGQLLASGVVREGDDGEQRDLFRGRLMIPIRDSDGRLSGFGGRALDDSEPKYLNSPQGEVFDKSRILYAMDRAKDDIRRDGAVIVEGYMDAIAAHEHGFANVVASMGTALTENQVSQLRSLAQNFVLALDPDAAGQEATLRSLESSWRVFRIVVARRSPSTQSVLSQFRPPALKIAELPAGQDPDTLIRNDSSLWESTVAEAQPLLDFVIPALVKRTDLSVQDNVVKIVSELSRLINQLDDSDQYPYLEKLSNQLNIPLEILRASIGGRGGGQRRRRRGNDQYDSGADLEISPGILTGETAEPVEEYVLALLIQHPNLIEGVRETDPQFFRHTENRQLFTTMLACHRIEELGEELDPFMYRLVSGLVGKELPSTSRNRQLGRDHCLSFLEKRHLRELQESLMKTETPQIAPSREIETTIRHINQRLRELESIRAG
jgi:DNA primase